MVPFNLPMWKIFQGYCQVVHCLVIRLREAFMLILHPGVTVIGVEPAVQAVTWACQPAAKEAPMWKVNGRINISVSVLSGFLPSCWACVAFPRAQASTCSEWVLGTRQACCAAPTKNWSTTRVSACKALAPPACLCQSLQLSQCLGPNLQNLGH